MTLSLEQANTLVQLVAKMKVAKTQTMDGYKEATKAVADFTVEHTQAILELVEADQQQRVWLVQIMKAAGLEGFVDLNELVATVQMMKDARDTARQEVGALLTNVTETEKKLKEKSEILDKIARIISNIPEGQAMFPHTELPLLIAASHNDWSQEVMRHVETHDKLDAANRRIAELEKGPP